MTYCILHHRNTCIRLCIKDPSSLGTRCYLIQVDPEIDRVEQNDGPVAIYARLDDQLDFRRIFRLGLTQLNSGQL